MVLKDIGHEINFAYYPASGHNFGIIQTLLENTRVKLIVFTECTMVLPDVDEVKQAVPGWDIESNEIIEAPFGGLWATYWHADVPAMVRPNDGLHFRITNNGRLVDFLYMRTDAIGTFQKMLEAKKVPDLVVLVENQDDDGLPPLTGEMSYLFNLTTLKTRPKFLYVWGGNAPWPQYRAYTPCQNDEVQVAEGENVYNLELYKSRYFAPRFPRAKAFHKSQCTPKLEDVWNRLAMQQSRDYALFNASILGLFDPMVYGINDENGISQWMFIYYDNLFFISAERLKWMDKITGGTLKIHDVVHWCRNKILEHGGSIDNNLELSYIILRSNKHHFR